MQPKKLTPHYKQYLPAVLLGIFAFSINYHYGFIGIMPGDNTVLYNGGYRVLRGYVPFSDYWLVTGPLLDYLNAFFFSIFGVSWKTYIIHSSFFNLIIALGSYYLFIKLNLSIKYSLFYSSLISILFYPVVGTPFVDHHSTLFLMLAFYMLILGVHVKNYTYFSAIPILICLSFLSKQTPAAYGLLAISLIILCYCLFNIKEINKILLPLIIGSIASICVLTLFFFLTGIKLLNFLEQYIYFSKTIGEYRITNYNFNIFDVIYKYKFINFFNIILFVILVNLFFKKKKNIKFIFIIFTSLALSLILIFHQFYTSNQNYIFFIIPFLCAILHTVYSSTFLKNYILIISILLCIFSVFKYHLRFNEHRKFNELEKVDLNKAVDAEQISTDLKGLKWITYIYPNNPQKEIDYLKNVIKIISSDKSKKAILTDYQFLSSTMDIYDYSPNQWHHSTVSFPIKGQKYFSSYKNFFINNLKKNEISFIYETTATERSITELIIDKTCFKKERLSEILIKFMLLKNCKDFQ